MPATYEPIATTTLGSSAADITFTSIPGTYTDLVLIMNYSITTANDSVFIRFNSDSATNYSDTAISGNGTSAISTRDSSSSIGIRLTAYNTAQSASTRQTSISHIQNYANSTTNKTVITRYSSSGGSEAAVGLWRKTPEAINSLTLRFSGAANFESGSIFTLYGIKAA